MPFRSNPMHSENNNIQHAWLKHVVTLVKTGQKAENKINSDNSCIKK